MENSRPNIWPLGLQPGASRKLHGELVPPQKGLTLQAGPLPWLVPSWGPLKERAPKGGVMLECRAHDALAVGEMGQPSSMAPLPRQKGGLPADSCPTTPSWEVRDPPPLLALLSQAAGPLGKDGGRAGRGDPAPSRQPDRHMPQRMPSHGGLPEGQGHVTGAERRAKEGRRAAKVRGCLDFPGYLLCSESITNRNTLRMGQRRGVPRGAAATAAAASPLPCIALLPEPVRQPGMQIINGHQACKTQASRRGREQRSILASPPAPAPTPTHAPSSLSPDPSKAKAQTAIDRRGRSPGWEQAICHCLQGRGREAAAGNSSAAGRSSTGLSWREGCRAHLHPPAIALRPVSLHGEAEHPSILHCQPA